jgi:TonB family protein
MDSYHRPLSIYDLVGDPTEDDAPILHATPPRDALVPGLLTLAFSASVFTVLMVCPDFLLNGGGLRSSATTRTSRQMDLILDPSFPELAPAPSADRGGGQPGGGNGAIDPALASHVVSNIPATILPPEDLQQIRFPDRAVLAGDSTLPVAPGGDGFRKGHGEGILGSGGSAKVGTNLTSVKVEPVSRFDYQLIPIKTAPALFVHTAKEMSEMLANPLVVVVTVNEDGKVINARVKSGPSQFHAAALKLAFQWAFDPLAKHGLKAPLEADIRFQPQMR